MRSRLLKEEPLLQKTVTDEKASQNVVEEELAKLKSSVFMSDELVTELT